MSKREKAFGSVDSAPRVAEFSLGQERFIVVGRPVPSVPRDLTPAEAAVAQAAAKGLPNSEIARRRGTTVATVANQLASVYEKLGVGDRLALARALLPPSSRGKVGGP